VSDDAADAVTVLGVDGLGEIGAGDDLAALVAERTPLHDGDVLVLTSKAVSKAEGRVVAGDRDRVVLAETDRQVAVRGRTAIVRTRTGLVLAAAGVDASNTRPGTVVLLPVEPDASAVRVRTALRAHTGRNVAVLVTDTAGRPWRTGQTDIAIGAAGIVPLREYAGSVDTYGNELSVTAPAVADELAGAADLVKGKLAGRPAAVVRGLAGLVLPAGENGPGARALVREEEQDMFGFGARDAVLRALAGDPADLRGFGAPAAADEVRDRLRALTGAPVRAASGEVLVDLADLTADGVGRLAAVAAAAAFALGWTRSGGPAAHRGERDLLRFRPAHP
jgi:coenzyme F420-0:L-glutamate ligase / coenzyme F420-1:gamma-L-glutamate ligase